MVETMSVPKPVLLTPSVMFHSFVEQTANAEHNVLVPTLVAALAYPVTVVREREIVILMMNVKDPWSVEKTTVQGMDSALLMTVAGSNKKARIQVKMMCIIVCI